MKMVKLSDFYPYDRNKGGIQELHHKIESKTLQYWGEDSGILIGITPIYKRRLWSEEVKVVNDKMTNMKTRTYEGVQHGDWVRCVLCGAQMLLPCGADKCPECGENGTLRWVDEENAEILRSSNIEGRYIQVNQEPCNTHVDWEQRRYEMAKTMLPITSVSGRGPHGELILEACD